jgi:hypothetical protein
MQTTKKPDRSAGWELPLFTPSSLVEAFLQRGKRFLKSLRVFKRRYKRYTGSPLRYAGGPSWAVGYIGEVLLTSVQRAASGMHELNYECKRIHLCASPKESKYKGLAREKHISTLRMQP